MVEGSCRKPQMLGALAVGSPRPQSTPRTAYVTVLQGERIKAAAKPRKRDWKPEDSLSQAGVPT